MLEEVFTVVQRVGGEKKYYSPSELKRAFSPPFVFLELTTKAVVIQINGIYNLKSGPVYLAIKDEKKYAATLKKAEEAATTIYASFIETKDAAPLQVEPAPPPLPQKMFRKQWSSHQDHEMTIYRHLAKTVDVYSVLPNELPDNQGIEMREFKEHRPEPKQIEKSYHRLVALLYQIHAAGVVCCDLKPQHVRETAEGELIIIDFDGATMLDGATIRGTGSFTMNWASADRLLGLPGHFLDDLETACKIAQFWQSLTPPPPMEHQREGLQCAAKELVRLLSPSADWLDDHLRYITSRKRGAFDENIYRLLGKSGFRFSPDQLASEFTHEQSHVKITTQQMKDTANISNIQGKLVERIVQDHLEKFFQSPIDRNLVSYNQQFGSDRVLTEWDFVIARHSGNLPLPNNKLPGACANLPGGLNLVGEVWTFTKLLDNVSKKVQVLYEGHRPIHTLYYFGYYLMISGGFIYENDEEKKLLKDMGLPQFFAFCLGSKLNDLSLLCAAGRVAFDFWDELSPVEILEVSIKTIFELTATVGEMKKEIGSLKSRVAMLEKQLAESKRA